MVCAGPCSVENEEDTVALAKALKDAGANTLRGERSSRVLHHTVSRDWVLKVCVYLIQLNRKQVCLSYLN